MAESNEPRAAGSESGEAPLALALSGGGFQAAAFHVGVLTVLHRADLLHRVQAVGATSGGALVAARWAVGLARGETFDETWFELSKFLQNERPVRRARLRATKDGSRTAGQALSKILDETLLADSRHPDPTLRELFASRSGPSHVYLDATDVDSGEPYSFAASRGAETLSLPRVVSEHLAISDVLACTCASPAIDIPSVSLPDDFRWPDERVAKEIEKAQGAGSIDLTSGDVVDLGALESSSRAASELPTAPAIHIASDGVGDPPEALGPRPLSGFGLPFVRLKLLGFLAFLSIIAGGASLYLLWEKVQAERAINDFRWPNDAIAFGVPMGFVVAAMLAALGAWIWVRGASAKLLGDTAGHVTNHRTARVVSHLSWRERVASRVLNDGAPRRNQALARRALAAEGAFGSVALNVSLRGFSSARAELVEGLEAPGESICAAAVRARALDQRFELDDRSQFSELALVGQAATIFELVEMLEGRYGTRRKSWPKDARRLDERLRSDWNTINGSAAPLRPEDHRGSTGPSDERKDSED